MSRSEITIAFLDAPVTLTVGHLVALLLIAVAVGYAIRWSEMKEWERQRGEETTDGPSSFT